MFIVIVIIVIIIVIVNCYFFVWFEVKCSLDYYVLHIKQPEKC